MAPPLQPHAVMVPFPETGHINPLMQLARFLASHGFVITFVNTQYNHHRILRSNSARLPSEQGLDIRLVGIPDGLSEDDNRDNDVSLMVNIVQNIGPVLQDLIENLNQQGPRVTCIISDVSAVRTLDVAKKFGIPRVGFWPPTVATHALICHASDAASKQAFPEMGVPDPPAIVSFPGIPDLPSTNLPWWVVCKEDSEPIFLSCARNVEALRDSEWVLCNSVSELEAKTLELLPKGFPTVSTVGPILPSEFLEKTCARGSRITTGLWPEDDECLDWLDTQATASVLYVSMGSIALLSKHQFEELAHGLEASQRPFLWVLRDIKGEGGFSLPEGFHERTSGRCKIVSWAPQLLVLAHSAVGGFLTHCGWNSTIESMSMGVPMLAWPQIVDQFLNAKLIVEEWGVGLAWDGETVAEQVRRLMEGDEGKEAKAKAAKAREVILAATREEGSSYTNLHRFLDWARLDIIKS